MRSKMTDRERDTAFLNAYFNAVMANGLLLLTIKRLRRNGALSADEVRDIFDQARRDPSPNLPPIAAAPAFREAWLEKLRALEEDVLS